MNGREGEVPVRPAEVQSPAQLSPIPQGSTGTASTVPVPRRKKLFRWAFRLILFLLLLALAVFALKDRILKRVAERSITAQTGLAATIEQLKVGLGSATLTLKGFKLYNPPEFGGTVLLDIPELFLKLDTAQAAVGKLRFKQFRLHLAELNLVKNRDGKINFDAFQEKPPSKPAAIGQANRSESGLVFAGIDHLELKLGQVNYSDLETPKNNQVFTLSVTNEVATNLKTSDDVRNWFGNFAFRLALQEIMNRSGGTNGRKMEVIIGEPAAPE